MTILSGTLADAGKTVSAYVQLDISLSSTTPPPDTGLLAKLQAAVGGTLAFGYGAASSFTVTAVNPDAAAVGFAGGRGPNQLELYCAPLTRTGTNKWGVEVAFDSSGAAIQMIDRRGVPAGSSADVSMTIPLNGFVASGHGTAADWLARAYTAGAEVVFTAPSAPPPPPPATGGSSSGGTTAHPGPRPLIAEWVMQWPGYGPRISALPATTNCAVLSFLQGAGQPVGWGNETQAELVIDLFAFRAATRGGVALAGVGGSGGAIDTGNQSAFTANVLAYRTSLQNNLDGLAWDIEASGLNQSDVLNISARLASQVPGWQTALAPNGSNVEQYLPVGVELQKEGLLSWFGQQFYDANVPLSAAEDRIDEALQAGIPPEKYVVGMMIAPDSQHWTLQQCIDNMTTIRQKYPTIGGAYLWEAGRAQSDQWSAAMAQVLA